MLAKVGIHSADKYHRELKRAGRRIVDLGGVSEDLSVAGAADESAGDEHPAVGEQGPRMTASADQQVLADRPLLGRRVIGLAEGSGEGSSPGHQHPPVGKQSGRRVARANALQVSGRHELSPDRVEALAQRCGVSREHGSAVDPSTDEEKRTERSGTGTVNSRSSALRASIGPALNASVVGSKRWGATRI